MIKSVIIEDEKRARVTLKKVLHDFCPEVTVLAEAEDIASGIQTIKEYQPELVFMDIRLPEGDAFSILDQFPSSNFEVIFVTAYNDYLRKAFDYFSLQYLNKPLDIEKLRKAVERFKQLKQPVYSTFKMEQLQNLLKDKIKIITIPFNNGIKILPISDIVRIEANGSYSQIYLTDGEHFMSTKWLGYYENLLDKYGFIRVHKSHLVNLDMITQISFNEGVTLTNDAVFPLSQKNRKELIKRIESRLAL